MKALVLLIALVLLPVTLDAAKGGGKPGSVDWTCYYDCVSMGGDRLECLAYCRR